MLSALFCHPKADQLFFCGFLTRTKLLVLSVRSTRTIKKMALEFIKKNICNVEETEFPSSTHENYYLCYSHQFIVLLTSLDFRPLLIRFQIYIKSNFCGSAALNSCFKLVQSCPAGLNYSFVCMMQHAVVERKTSI